MPVRTQAVGVFQGGVGLIDRCSCGTSTARLGVAHGGQVAAVLCRHRLGRGLQGVAREAVLRNMAFEHLVRERFELDLHLGPLVFAELRLHEGDLGLIDQQHRLHPLGIADAAEDRALLEIGALVFRVERRARPVEQVLVAVLVFGYFGRGSTVPSNRGHQAQPGPVLYALGELSADRRQGFLDLGDFGVGRRDRRAAGAGDLGAPFSYSAAWPSSLAISRSRSTLLSRASSVPALTSSPGSTKTFSISPPSGTAT